MYRNISYNGYSLYYQYLGAGPVVVLLHGFGEDSTVWEFQKVLADHFTLLLPDLPGSGHSQSTTDMSMEGLADTLHFILLQEGIKECIVIGHSMGGYVTLAFAEKYASCLHGIGLFHSTAFADDTEKIATRKKGIAFMTEHGAAAFLKTTTPNLYSPATKETKPALIEAQLACANGFSKEPLIAYYEAMIQRPDRMNSLRTIMVPVLFILGRWDNAVPLQGGLEQCYMPQIAYIHVLEHSGHMGLVEEPEKSNAFLHHYLSETFGLL